MYPVVLPLTVLVCSIESLVDAHFLALVPAGRLFALGHFWRSRHAAGWRVAQDLFCSRAIRLLPVCKLAFSALLPSKQLLSYRSSSTGVQHAGRPMLAKQPLRNGAGQHAAQEQLTRR